MNRRQLLKLLALGIIGHELDIDRLLWIPNQKKIFIPKGISYNELVSTEIDRIMPAIRMLFERDNTFYEIIKRNEPSSIS